MERKIVLLPLLAFLFVSCAENGFHAPLASLKDEKPTTTYAPPEPVSRIIKSKDENQSFKVVEGLSVPNGFTFDLDSKTAEAKLKGSITIKVVGSNPLNVPVEVAGKINSETLSGILPATNQAALDALGAKAGASITCLNESCSESFIDVYVKHNGYVYHHQLQVSGKNVDKAPEGNGKNSDANAENETAKKDPKNPAPAGSGKDPQPKAPAPKKPSAPLGQAAADDDGSAYEHDIDDEAEAGTYVGDPQKDLAELFPEAPSVDAPKTNPPAAEQPKAPVPPSVPAKGQDDKKPAPSVPVTPPKKEDKKSETGPLDAVKAILKGLGQAVTAVGKNNFTRGHLENAANVYDYETSTRDPGFHILYPKRETYFATDDMRNVLAAMGQYNNKYMKGYSLSIGDLSRKSGGQLGRHSSHQMGLDADIAYYFDDQSKQKGMVDAVSSSKPVRSFMAEEQWALFKSLVEQRNVDRIFVHAALKKELCNIAARGGDLKPGETETVAFETLRILRPEPNHDNHFHLRLKCSTAQPRCRQMAPPAKASGC